MRCPRGAVVALSFVLATCTVPALAAPSSPHPEVELTDAQVADMDPVAQAALLDPLRAAAQAVDQVGRSHWSKVYAGVAIDADRERTDLYLTDARQATALLAAVRRVDPDAGAFVEVHRAAFSSATLHEASLRFLTQPHSYEAYSVAPAPDASGLQVEVPNPGSVTRLSLSRFDTTEAVETGVPVTFLAGPARQPHSWSNWKWHDRSPFIGGDVLTPDGRDYCTAGLPAVRRRNGHPVLLTAAHCFGAGRRIYTAAGRTWNWGNRRTGNYVGTVTSRNTTYDAEILSGADNNADESDTTGWKPLTSVARSYRGDYVCHSGARSAYRGHPTPCGIKVTRTSIYFREGGHYVHGVEGVDVRHRWGSVNGDSGATVFAVTGVRSRQLRGMVSSGGEDGTSEQARVDWPEAVDIFRVFGLRLNPRT